MTDISPPKNLKVTFSVTALVSPEEFAKHMGYPPGSPENELEFDKWGKEEFEECICTYSSQYSGWTQFFRITDRQVVKVEETDEPWNREFPPKTQKEMRIKAWITSEELVPSKLPSSDCDAITYSILTPCGLNPLSEDYQTEVLIVVDQAKAKAWVEGERAFYEKNDPETAEAYVWNGNIFKSGYWDSPDCALVEDGICPGGYGDQVDYEYMGGSE